MDYRNEISHFLEGKEYLCMECHGFYRWWKYVAGIESQNLLCCVTNENTPLRT